MVHAAFISDLYRRIHFICYIQTYISFVASFIHIWMVLVFTAERFFAVNFPLKHMSQCTPNLSRLVILIVIIPAFISYIHPAFFVSEVDNEGQCREKDGYESYMKTINTIDTIMTMFLPFILVSVLNILIIRKLFCSKVFRQHVFANGSSYQCRRISNGNKRSDATQIKYITSSVPPQSNFILSHNCQRFVRTSRPVASQPTSAVVCRTYNSCESLNASLTNNKEHHNNSHNHALNDHQSSIKLKSNLKAKYNLISKRHESAHRHVLTELRLTKMLLAISLTCLSLNFPSYYVRFIVLYRLSKENSSSSSSPPPPSSDTANATESDFELYRGVIFHCMSYLSYSINIFIYLLFGGNFRRALKRLFSLKSSHSDNLTATFRQKALIYHDQNYGNLADYDSTLMTSSSLNGSLRSFTKTFKSREQSNLTHHQHK